MLSAGEIQRDMARPAAPAPGLAAGYTFDGRSKATAADVSGQGNTGEIAGATRTRGRHGGALRFDGASAVVRVPPAPSLNLTRAITLSAWIRPEARQSGWRTIIQRQTDAYFLIASSDRINQDGAIDGVRIVLIAAAARVVPARDRVAARAGAAPALVDARRAVRARLARATWRSRRTAR